MLVDGYHLKSDLARVCLPAPQGHPQRTLAWINSVCLLFLFVGLAGGSSVLPMVKRVAPIEEPVPIVIQPIAPPPPQTEERRREEPDDSKSFAPRVVVVTPESPSINFSVPTIGNVVVPNAVAEAPPVAALRSVEPVHNRPQAIDSTGEGGDRPEPPYPPMALKFGQQGTVVLLLTVNDSGQVESITIKESSGSGLLDRSARDWIKRHWVVPPGKGGRVFEAPIAYKFQAN